MNRTDRLYALVEELRATAPRPHSARRLAERFEVSSRTIERDILALQESGVPIYAETGRRGGYTIDKAATLPPLNFTAAELVAIAVALAREGRTPFAAANRSALAKVVAATSAAQTAEASELMDRVRLVEVGRRGAPQRRPDTPSGADTREEPPGSSGTPGSSGSDGSDGSDAPGVPLAIQNAITARRVLRIEYRDRRDVSTVREVEPVAFVGSASQWYLMAWCRLRDSGRAFRLDRISAVTETGEPAPHRSYADLKVDIPSELVRRPGLPVVSG
jgi:predicted DNA-binding transcriptional regulator YafY